MPQVLNHSVSFVFFSQTVWKISAIFIGDNIADEICEKFLHICKIQTEIFEFSKNQYSIEAVGGRLVNALGKEALHETTVCYGCIVFKSK